MTDLPTTRTHHNHRPPACTWALALGCCLLAGTSQARNLQADFQAASQHEPVYSAAQTQSRNMRIEASIAGTAYYPRAGISLSQDATDNSTRRTARIVQPVVSAERWLTTREATPRETIASQLEAQARIDLASRTLLQVGVEEASIADSVFSILMGDDVEQRKHFIQTNAKDVRFLDI